MIPAKPLDRAISNIKYQVGKYYVRMGLSMERFFQPSPPQDPYVINEWPLTHTETPENYLIIYSIGSFF